MIDIDPISSRKPARSIGFFGATSMIVGLVIGASIFILPGPVAADVGPGLPVAYLIAVIPAIMVVLYLIQLAAVLPVTGSNYVAATRFASPLGGYVVFWMNLLIVAFAGPAMAIGFGSYFQNFVPEAPVTLTSVVIVVILTGLNLVGAKATTMVQTVLTVLFLAALVLYVVGGVPHIDTANYSTPFPNGLNGLLIGVVTVYFSFTGFSFISEIAGEVKDARKVIPRAVVASVVIVLLVYVGVSATLTGTLDWESAAVAALTDSAATFYPPELVTLISLGALFAASTTINAVFLAIPRDMLKLSQDRIGPKWLAKTTPKNGTPYAGIIVLAVITIGSILLQLDVSQYALVAVFSFLTMSSIVAIAVFRIPRLNPDLWAAAPIQYPRALRLFSLYGLLVMAVAIFAFAAVADPTSMTVFIIVTAFGVLLWFIRKFQLKRQGIDVEKQMREFTDDISGELID